MQYESNAYTPNIHISLQPALMDSLESLWQLAETLSSHAVLSVLCMANKESIYLSLKA